LPVTLPVLSSTFSTLVLSKEIFGNSAALKKSGPLRSLSRWSKAVWIEPA